MCSGLNLCLFVYLRSNCLFIYCRFGVGLYTIAELCTCGNWTVVAMSWKIHEGWLSYDASARCFFNSSVTQYDVVWWDEMRYDCNVLKNEHKRLMDTMTQEQKHVYDTIISRVDSNLPGLFFVYGYGGTGKTFIWRAYHQQFDLEVILCWQLLRVVLLHCSYLVEELLTLGLQFH